jgi:hypothetical protein
MIKSLIKLRGRENNKKIETRKTLVSEVISTKVDYSTSASMMSSSSAFLAACSLLPPCSLA